MNAAIRLSSIAALLLTFLSPAANAANVDPLSKLHKLPAKADEAELWDIASRHENDLRNSGRIFHDRHVEAYLESIELYRSSTRYEISGEFVVAAGRSG